MIVGVIEIVMVRVTSGKDGGEDEGDRCCYIPNYPLPEPRARVLRWQFKEQQPREFVGVNALAREECWE